MPHRASLPPTLLLAFAALFACNEGVLDTGDVVIHEVVDDLSNPDGGLDTTPGADTCPAVIRFGGAAARVSAAGLWNDFSRDATPLDEVAGGFEAAIHLAPGEYPFKFVIDGTFEDAPPADVPTHWHEGVENRNLIVADCFAPRVWVEEGPTLSEPTPASESRRIDARVCAAPGEGGSPLVEASFRLTVGGTPIDATLLPGDGGALCAALSEQRMPGKHTIRAEVEDAAGRRAELFFPLWVERTPFAWPGALLYMTMVDRFADSDGVSAPASDVAPIANHMGGDFGGLRDRIRDGHFQRLGVDAIWLTPVLANPDGGWLGLDGINRFSGYHGYWPIDPAVIDPRLAEDGAESPEAAFDALVAEAHAAGLRVVMDVVLNHVHEQHLYCEERPEMCRRTCVCGTDGCPWDGRALDCQFAAYLPDLDHRDHTTLRRVLGDVLAFVVRHDIDALRVDAVKHFDRAAITNLRARIDTIDDRLAPFWLVGETFTGGGAHGELLPAIGPGALDGQFDFPLYWAIRDAFVFGGGFRALEAAVAASEAAYGDALPLMSPFAGNHDVERLATALAGNDLGPFGATPDLLAGTTGETPERWDILNPMSMALAFTLTLPGVPLLYGGDEVGLAGSGDPDNRRMFPTSLSADQAELLRRVAEVGQLRRRQPALRTGARREIWLDEDTLVQARWLDATPSEGARVVLFAMNRGETKEIQVTLPEVLGLPADARLRSLLSDRSATASGGVVTLTLAPWEYVFFGAEEGLSR